MVGKVIAFAKQGFGFDTVFGRRLVGDMIYIRTWEGWLHLATVIDLASLKIVGYAMADQMRAGLVCDTHAYGAAPAPVDAIDEALRSPCPATRHCDDPLNPGRTPRRWPALRTKWNVSQSMLGRRQCWYNAVAG